MDSPVKMDICGVTRNDAATSFLLGGGGGVGGFIGTQTRLPPKSSFSSDFDHLILKMLENA